MGYIEERLDMIWEQCSHDDWDSYDAIAVTRAAIDAANGYAHYVKNTFDVVDDLFISPYPAGGVQVEFSVAGEPWDYEVCFDSKGNLDPHWSAYRYYSGQYDDGGFDQIDPLNLDPI